MTKLLPILLALAVGVAAAILFYHRPRTVQGASVVEGVERARAYFLNENNQDYRRARQELLALASQLEDRPAYHLNLALIDIAEINYEVQGQYLTLREYRRFEHLLISARGRLERARAMDPRNDALAYNLARVYIKLAPYSDDPDRLWQAAEALLNPLLEQERPDPSALLLFAECRDAADDWEGVADACARIKEQGEDFVPRTLYRVGVFRFARALISVPDRRDEGLRLQREYEQEFGDPGRAAPGALERGRYTEFLDLVDAPAVRPDPRRMNWRDVTSRTGVPALSRSPFLIAPDLDRDCARDLVVMGESGMRVLRNRRNATFEDVTEASGLPLDLVVTAAAVGDIDNDEDDDLVVGGPGGIRIFLNDTDPDDPGRWLFAPVMASVFGGTQEDPVTCIALWDLDHDGDLDIFVGGPESNRVYRTRIEEDPLHTMILFEDYTEKLGLAQPAAARALILDVDNDHDVDLLVTGPRGNAWFENLRELRFARYDLPDGAGLAAGDVDNDLLEEILIGGTVYKFADRTLVEHSTRTALLDLDGDGILDADPFAGIALQGPLLDAIGADLNRDGDRDLILLFPEGARVYLSLPERPTAWIDVQTRGLHTNRAGIGARVNLYAGDLRIGATSRDGLVSFGLGARTEIQAVSLLWTNGVEQGIVLPLMNDCLEVLEREGEVGSCPFLYAFDGTKWNFITDCHSGTPLGLPHADGKFLPPRSDETVFIPGAKLEPSDGALKLDVAEELREILYLDRVVLHAIDHPPEVRPVLNEAFRVMSHPDFRVYGLDDLRPPRAARDHKGRDLLPLVGKRDKKHAVVFEEHGSQYEGLAREWAIELDFGDVDPAAERILFVMDGWIEFPTASSSIASSQTKSVRFMLPVLEALAPDGSWVVIDEEPGFPAGKSKSVLVDLTGKLPSKRARLRLRSTLLLHWDAFFLSTGSDKEVRLTEIPLVSATHRYRGMGEPVIDPEGELPWHYSHDLLMEAPRWGQWPRGMLTRYGDVLQLLRNKDSRYPTVAAGDVVELVFDAQALPRLKEGWVRDWCFTTNGWVKDADMNQAVRETVTPLPFHGMSGYPYPQTENHPHPEWVQEWFTRPSRRLDNSPLYTRTR